MLISETFEQNGYRHGNHFVYTSALAQSVQDASSQDNIDQTHQIFIDNVYKLLQQYYSDPELDAQFMAEQLAMSHNQLERKVKAVLDFTPTEMIRRYRLKKAAQLLFQGIDSSKVARRVGFSSHTYFTQCFKAQFDCLPIEYGKQ